MTGRYLEGSHEEPLMFPRIVQGAYDAHEHFAALGAMPLLLDLNPEELADLEARVAATFRQYPSDEPDKRLRFYGPTGLITLVRDADVPRGMHRWRLA
jgi:hypothetical protein